jgi:hypothetical protein
MMFAVACKSRDLVARVAQIRAALESPQIDQLSALMGPTMAIVIRPRDGRVLEVRKCKG